MKRTTKKQFETFKKEFLRVQKKFGLTEWRVYFKHQKINEGYAEIDIDLDGMVATVVLNKELPDHAADGINPKESGIHEALHLLLGRLNTFAKRRYVTPDDIYEETEALVRRIEKLEI